MNHYQIPRTELITSRLAYGCDKLGWDSEGITTQEQNDERAVILLNEPISLDAECIAKSERLINVAYDNGITLFDLADVYGIGRSEAAFGHVLARNPGLRNKIVIQSKCGTLSGQSRSAAMIASVEGSLKRLKTDHLDILLLHVQDALMEPQEVASAFEALKQSGKARYFGVSNHTIMRIELLKRYVRQPLVVHQIQLGLAHSDLLDETYFTGGGFHLTGPYTGIAGVDYCRLNDLQVQAYSPLKGKNIFAAPPLLSPAPDAPQAVRNAADLLERVAKKRGITPSSLSLAWLLRHPSRILPLVGATNPNHIADSCIADTIDLTDEEWQDLFWTARAAREFI